MAKQLENKDLQKVVANNGYDDLGVGDFMVMVLYWWVNTIPQNVTQLATLSEEDLRSAKRRRAASVGRQCSQEEEHV